MPEWSQFTPLDWVIIVILLVSTLLSLWRGFVREALSLAGWVAAFLVANIFGDQMASLLAGAIENITGRYVAAYAILFVGTLVATTFVTHLASQFVRLTGLTLLDRLLGTGFGFARGIILLLVVGYIMRQLVPPTELLWLDTSSLMPHVDMLGDWAQELFARANSGQWPAPSS